MTDLKKPDAVANNVNDPEDLEARHKNRGMNAKNT